MTNTGARRELTIDGEQRTTNDPRPTVAYAYVGPRYFDTLRIRMVLGRQLAEEDGRKGTEGVVVNQRFASTFFGHRDPLGKRIRLVNAAAPNTDVPWFTIVGISQTIPWALFRDEPDPMVYVPVAAEPAPHRFASVIARSRPDTAAAFAQIRQEVGRVDPDLPGYFVQTLDEVVAVGAVSAEAVRRNLSPACGHRVDSFNGRVVRADGQPRGGTHAGNRGPIGTGRSVSGGCVALHAEWHCPAGHWPLHWTRRVDVRWQAPSRSVRPRARC